MNKSHTTDNRIIYLDYLRVLAVFAVVVLHVSAQNWYSAEISSYTWAVFNFYDSAVRWAVPVFVMVSGTLFLNRDIPPKTLFTKYVLRLVVAYVFWSFLYAVIAGGDIKIILINTLRGHYHMWFIPMLIGIYLSIPICKQIAKSETVVPYFLATTGVVALFIPHILFLIKDFGPEPLVSLVGLLEPHLNNAASSMMLGFSFYFILGYYLNKTEFSKKQRLAIYILGWLGFMMTACTTYFASRHMSAPNTNYYGAFTLGTLAQSVAVFVFCKYLCQRKSNLCSLLSKTSFGIYWVHAAILDLLENHLVDTLSFSPYFSVPVISIAVFILSFVLVWLVRRVPLWKRYLV